MARVRISGKGRVVSIYSVDNIYNGTVYFQRRQDND